MVTIAQRKELIVMSNVLNANQKLVDYTEGSTRMILVKYTWADVLARFRKGLHIDGDCDSTVTGMFKWDGIADPNGDNYDGYGFTGSLLDHLPHFSNIRDAHTGTIGVFGAGTGKHCIMYLAADGEPDNPWVFTHGTEQGPFIMRFNNIASVFVGQPFTWLSIEGL